MSSSDDDRFTIELLQQHDYRFEARFDHAAVPPLVVDEGPPLGGDAGPDPVRLLAVAVGHCLAASLLFALRKLRNDPGALHASVSVRMVRNAQRRLRVGGIDVELRLGVSAAELPMLGRALAQFEDYCTVTQSVRGGLPVQVRVFDAGGVSVEARGDAA